MAVKLIRAMLSGESETEFCWNLGQYGIDDKPIE